MGTSHNVSKPDPAIRAFTLIEAVLALAILSISVFVLAEATARCLAVIRVSRNYQIARSVLEQGEAEHPMDRSKTPSENEMNKTYDNGFTFERRLTEVSDMENLYKVLRRISWSESGRSAFEETVSYYYIIAAEE